MRVISISELEGLVEKDGRRYDTSLLIDDAGMLLGEQKMVHIAQAACFYEQDYYTPSEEGFRVFDTPIGKIGIVVCFDRHYPESIRTEALKGAELILVPTVNTKDEPSELFQWEIRIQAYVTMDLTGYRTGSMNETIRKEDRTSEL